MGYKNINISSLVSKEIQNRADKLGLTFSDVAEALMRESLRIEPDPSYVLLNAVSKWLLDKHSQKNFPADITFRVFQEIQQNREWIRLYDLATNLDTAAQKRDHKKKSSLNRKLGLAIKRTLDAKVQARVTLLDKSSLIQAYSSLLPSSKSS